MDMTSAAEARSWYENQRIGSSPNTANSVGHQNSSSGLDASDMGAFYALENGSPHRRYGYGYGSHGESFFYLIFLLFFFILFKCKKKRDYFRCASVVKIKFM